MLSGISRIAQRPSAPCAHSTRTHSSASTWPFEPTARFVSTAQSRSQPSSCEDEVRSFNGQSGQTSALFSCSGGLGRISSCVIDSAPCRFEVPMQSEPVSPPPITIDMLAGRADRAVRRRLGLVVAGDALVLLRQEIHREMDAGEIAPGHFEIARQFGAAGQRHRIVLRQQLADRRHRPRPRRRCGTRPPRPPSARRGGRSAISPS